MSGQSRVQQSASARPEPALPVVAGFDGSSAAFAAARYAADEAHRRGLPLILVHGFTWPWTYPPLHAAPEPPDPHPRALASGQLAEAARRIKEEYGDELVVDQRMPDGNAAAVLADYSRRATLVVVGHRGTGGFAGLLAGSVAVHVATHASCPVIVVRGAPGKPDAPVVVGVDGSAGAKLATEFAFQDAARRGAPLRVVSVWPPDHGWPDALRAAGYPATPATDTVTADIAESTGRHPEVEVSVEVIRGRSPAGGLIAAADGASLVVVGSRGLGGLRGLLLGSVGRALIEHAPCPVAVVRPTV
jgi:nucleotide-binding universal stress UspA family protein